MADVPVADYIVDFFDASKIKAGQPLVWLDPITSFYQLSIGAAGEKRSFGFMLPPGTLASVNLESKKDPVPACGIFSFVARADPPQASFTFRVTFNPPPDGASPSKNSAAYSLWSTTDTRTLHKVFGPIKAGMQIIDIEIIQVFTPTGGVMTFRDLVFWYRRLAASPTTKQK